MERDDLIKELWAEGKGKSLRGIGRQLGVSHVSILKRLRRMGVKPYVQTLPKETGESHTLKGSAQEKEEGITVPEKTPPYFIKDGTDEIFCYTRFLAERVDMRPFWGTLEEFREEKAKEKGMPKVERD